MAGLVDGRRLLRRPLDHSPEAGDLLVGSVQLLRQAALSGSARPSEATSRERPTILETRLPSTVLQRGSVLPSLLKA